MTLVLLFSDDLTLFRLSYPFPLFVPFPMTLVLPFSDDLTLFRLSNPFSLIVPFPVTLVLPFSDDFTLFRSSYPIPMILPFSAVLILLRLPFLMSLPFSDDLTLFHVSKEIYLSLSYRIFSRLLLNFNSPVFATFSTYFHCLHLGSPRYCVDIYLNKKCPPLKWIFSTLKMAMMKIIVCFIPSMGWTPLDEIND